MRILWLRLRNSSGRTIVRYAGVEVDFANVGNTARSGKFLAARSNSDVALDAIRKIRTKRPGIIKSVSERERCKFTGGAEINHERSLRLQYLAGLSLNDEGSNVIFDEMRAYRHYPADLFVARPATAAALHKSFGP